MRLKAATAEGQVSPTLLHDALRQNRELWLTLAVDLASPDNLCSDELKASLISIAGFVERNTQSAAKNEDVLQTFIEINESIAAGLSDTPAPRSHLKPVPAPCPASS